MNRRTRLTIIGIGAGVYGLSGPGQTAGFSVFVDPVSAALGLSRAELTTIYLGATLLAAPTGIWLGRHLDRQRTATMIRIVATMLATALVIVALAPSAPILALGVFGLRAFGQSGMSLTSTVLVARAIDVRRGAALGWLAALAGFAITLTPLLASRVIPVAGWRQTWLLLAATVLIGSYLLAGLTGRLNLDGNGRAATDAHEHDDHEHDEHETEPDIVDDVVADGEIVATERQRRWALVVVTSAVATTGGVVTALAFHQIAVLGERGLSATAAATNFLPQSIAAATCAIVVGRAVDRLPGRLVLASVMGVLILALASLWLVDSPVTAVLFGLLLGTGVAANHASEGALLVRWTGTEGLGARRGRMMAIAVAATAVAPLTFTLLSDLTGSFTRAASVLTVLPLLVAVGALSAPLAEPKLWSRAESSGVLEAVANHDKA